MAGFDNEVMFAIGERLQPSTSIAITLMQQASTDVARINFTGNPNGNVAANPSSLCHDPTTGNFYLKVSGTGNTGWSQITAGLSSPTTSNATPQFSGNNLDFGISNLALGSSLPAITSGTRDVCYGQNAGAALTSGSDNTCIGWSANLIGTTGGQNTVVGSAALSQVAVSQGNTAIGYSTLGNYTGTTGQNIAIGNVALDGPWTGSYNIGLGVFSGSAWTGTESNNILIGSNGAVGDNNTIRIGTQGTGQQQQNAIFAAGITGTTVASSAPVAVNSAGRLSSLGFGTSGQLLVSGGAAVSPSWSTVNYGATITGNTGGAIAPVSGNWNLVTSNSTVGFAGTAGTETLNLGIDNMIMGSNPAGLTSPASQNVGFGQSTLLSLTTGSGNSCFGIGTGSLMTTASNNTFIGSGCGQMNVVSLGNTGVGTQVLAKSAGPNTGGNNTCVGVMAGTNLTTGAGNTLIGANAGTSLASTEVNNTYLGTNITGVAGENNVLRIAIGTAPATTAYVGGISGVTVAGSAPVAIASTGQVSSLGFGTANQVLTSNGTGNSPTWQAVPSSAFTWSDQAASFTAAANNGYFVTATATATLPASPTQGQTIDFAVDSASGILTIQANTGQFIRSGTAISASAGTAVSNFNGDTMELVYRAADTTWISLSRTGTWTIT